jgi:hypothetical protein
VPPYVDGVGASEEPRSIQGGRSGGDQHQSQRHENDQLVAGEHRNKLTERSARVKRPKVALRAGFQGV